MRMSRNGLKEVGYKYINYWNGRGDFRGVRGNWTERGS